MDTGTSFKIDCQSITDKVYHHIKQLILSGHLKGGEKVPERKVAEQLKISRTPVREAVQRLEEYGLISIKPRSYAVVVELPVEEFFNVSIIRFSLEKLAFRLLCETAVKDDIAYLRKLIKKCAVLFGKKRYAEGFEVDGAFHLEVARRTGNSHLYEALERLDAKIQLMRLHVHLSPNHQIGEELELSDRQHEQLIDALIEKNLQKIDEILKCHIMNKIP
jgi:DNA-binding GntR family transcriptional regulator